MARQKGIIQIRGTQGDTTYVDSKLYGQHTRARRKSGPVNDVLKAHAKRTGSANKICKSIKDPFDPFRENFKDGTFWSRLLSLIRKQLAKQKIFDWTALENFEFFAAHKLDSLMYTEITSSIEEQILSTTVLACPRDSLKNKKATHCRQSMIALFLDKDSKPTISSESTIFPSTFTEYQTHTAHWTISPEATIVLVALKCELFKEGDGDAKEQPNVKGMKIVRALDLNAMDKNKKWTLTNGVRTYWSKNFETLAEMAAEEDDD